jgi:hypothetical protein
MDKPTNFESANDRNAWIIKNAEHFVAFRMLNRERQRLEAKSLDDARLKAAHLLAENNSKPVLIYAVNGISDTFVEMVKPEGSQ